MNTLVQKEQQVKSIDSPEYNVTESSSAQIKNTLLPLLASLLLGSLVGLLVPRLSLTMAVIAISGIIIIFISLRRPEFAILLILTGSSSIFAVGSLPTVKIGFAFTVVELGLIFLLGITFLRLIARTINYVKTPLDLPIALFFVASFVSLMNSVINLGTDVNEMEYQWRILFGYLIFFAVTNLVRTRKQLVTLVTGMMVLAFSTVILMLVQESIGTSVAFLALRVETAGVAGGNYYGATRIVPPGQSLILTMLFPALLLFIFREDNSFRNRLGFFLALFLLTGLALTYTRSMWLGMVLAIAIVALSITLEQRKNLVVFFSLTVALGLIVIPLLNAYTTKTGVIIDSLYARGASLFEPENATSESLWQRRREEIDYAQIHIKKHPLLGIGPGADYRPNRWSGDGLAGYVHNAFYFILLDMGIVGVIPFIWFSIVFLVRGFRLWPIIQNKFYKAIAFGFVVSFIAIIVHSIAMPAFMDWYWTPVLGVMFGVNEVIYRIIRGEKSK